MSEETETQEENKTRKYKPLIFLGILCLVLLVALGVGGYLLKNNPDTQPLEQSEVSSNDLYKIFLKNSDEIMFINEQGEEIFRVNRNKYDYFGDYSEGAVFLVKIIKELSIDKELVKMTIFDNKGNVIKVLPYNLVLYLSMMGDPHPYTIPYFHNGIEQLELENGSKIYVDKTGNEIKPPKGWHFEYEKYMKKYKGDFPARVDARYSMDKNGPFPFYTADCSLGGCIGYKDTSGKTVIEAKFKEATGTCDETRDPHFYNGIAMVCLDGTCENRRFINKNGNYINNETYEWAEPFWRRLTFVATSTKQGYINTKGEWVYVEKD